MKALVCRAFGPLDDLALEEVPSPRPGPGQILIDVKACSLNFPDLLMVKGLYQVKPPLPFSPGAESAGVVVEAGPGTGAFAPGDRVAAVGGWGGLAQRRVADADRVVPLPGEMDFETGATFFYASQTALHALRDRGRLEAGETLLVLGAAGGVGLAAVEIGKAMGARVIAAASSGEKLALCRMRGADETVNYAEENPRDGVMRLTGGNGADVVFDPVGGPYTEAALRATARGGRLLVVGFAAGTIPRVPLNLALLQERAIVGVSLSASFERDPDGHRRNARRLVEWLSAGVLMKPAVTLRVPLRDAVAAMKRMEGRKILGKVVVLPDG